MTAPTSRHFSAATDKFAYAQAFTSPTSARLRAHRGHREHRLVRRGIAVVTGRGKTTPAPHRPV